MIRATSDQSRPIRILHVVGRMNRGGVETWLLHVLRQVDRARIQMDFLVHSHEPGAYDAELRSLGSRIIPCMRPSRPWEYARNFRRLVREHGPYDIVHSHVYLFSGLVMMLAARCGVPRRVSHIYPHIDAKSGIHRRLQARLLAGLMARHASGLLADSSSSMDAFLKLGSFGHIPKEVIHPIALDWGAFNRDVDKAAIRRRLGLPQEVPVVAYVARFEPHKNHAQVFRLAEMLDATSGRVHFALVGSHGRLMESVRGCAADHSNVTLLTGVSDVSEVLLASDLFLFPSLNEGFGLVAVEAAAAGLPIVATNLPTLRESVPPSHHRFMFDPDDDRAARDNVLEILADPSLSASLSVEARQWATELSETNDWSRLLGFYDSLDARRGPGFERALVSSLPEQSRKGSGQGWK